MEYDFSLTFCNPISKDDEVEIPFILANNSSAIKWLKMLYEDIYIRNCDWCNNRFVGFGKIDEEKNKIKNEMNDIFLFCETERPGHFDVKIENNMDQNEFNRLHKWIEIYRGDLYNPHHFFIGGTQKFKYSLERLNQLIHAWESLDTLFLNNAAYIDINLNDCSRVPLDSNDYNNFEFMKYKNSIVLDFAARGKTLMSYWQDNDDHIGDHNIKRHEYFSSCFQIRVCDGWDEMTKNKKIKEFDEWFDRKENFLNSLMFYRNDVSIGLGWLTLAHVSKEISDLKELISSRQYLKTIKIMEH